MLLLVGQINSHKDPADMQQKFKEIMTKDGNNWRDLETGRSSITVL